MRISKENKRTKIIELYKVGWSYSHLQKHYHISPRDIAQIVKGIEVKCTNCRQLKGKVRFHAHYPDRLNSPDYTIPLCPSCHAKEEARIRKERQNQPETLVTTPGPDLISKHTPAILPTAPLGPLSPTGKKVVIGLAAVAVVDALFPTFFPKMKTSFQG